MQQCRTLKGEGIQQQWQYQTTKRENGKRGKETDRCIRHLTVTFTGVSYKGALHQLGKGETLSQIYQYEVRGRRYEAIGFANLSGGYELRNDKTFKGTVAPKDITPIFENKPQPVCLFEGFMDFLSFLSMKEEVNNRCLVLNSVSNIGRSISYLNNHQVSSIRTFLDNDDAGRRATQELIMAGFKVEDISVHYGNFKDLNEYHVSRVREQQKKLEKTPKTSNKVKQVKLKIR